MCKQVSEAWMLPLGLRPAWRPVSTTRFSSFLLLPGLLEPQSTLAPTPLGTSSEPGAFLFLAHSHGSGLIPECTSLQLGAPPTTVPASHPTAAYLASPSPLSLRLIPSPCPHPLPSQEVPAPPATGLPSGDPVRKCQRHGPHCLGAPIAL